MVASRDDCGCDVTELEISVAAVVRRALVMPWRQEWKLEHLRVVMLPRREH